MSRRRLQLKGSLYKDGSWWRLRWWEDVRTADGTVKRVRRSSVVGPCKGPDAISKREAQLRAWENVLSHVNAAMTTPASLMTLGQYIVQHFEPEWVWALKRAGKLHYQYAFRRIIPALGDISLRELRATDIQRLCKYLIDEGHGRTAEQVRTVIHTIIEHARRNGYFSGENPAKMVMLPERVEKIPQALTWEQAVEVLDRLKSPIREMVLLSMTTSANVAELCALRWKRVNLSDETVVVDGVTIPPHCFAIVENYYRGEFGSTKAKARNRVQPIPSVVVPLLAGLKLSRMPAPDDLVFSSRNGTPIDAHNVNNRVFKVIGKELGIKLSWHVFRHTCATFAERIDMPRSERIALMGHAKGVMTDRYTHADIERRRGYVNDLAERLVRGEKEGIPTPTVEELRELYERE